MSDVELLHEFELQRGRNGRAREMTVLRRYIHRGYRPIALGDKQVRRIFNVVGLCADFVFESRPGTCLLGDSKGSGIGDAVRQLRNTARYLRPRFKFIEPQIVIIKPEKISEVVAVGEGCVAKKHRVSGAYVLLDANGRAVHLEAGEEVEVVFGS